MSSFSRTRLAPSPTGALHLGNARTFLINWALARQRGWEIALRIEDLDAPRLKRGAARQSIDLLSWLGLDWDTGPTYQSRDLAPYHEVLTRLARDGRIYPCACTRSEIAAAQSAPHGDGSELRYPGFCRPPLATPTTFSPTPHPQPSTRPEQAPTPTAWRLRVADQEIHFIDAFAGEQCFNVQRGVGDFIVATKAGLPSYQLAVVVDDAASGVTHVVRGDDLLSSTPRQLLLMRELGIEPPLAYFHLPLVRGPDGRRLAKRHGDTRLITYRQRGVGPERIIGLIASWCGLVREPMTAAEFTRGFDLARLPSAPVTCTPEDDAWLSEHAARTSGM